MNNNIQKFHEISDENRMWLEEYWYINLKCQILQIFTAIISYSKELFYQILARKYIVYAATNNNIKKVHEISFRYRM